MPRIKATTVAEHRELQRRAVLDAARELLASTGEAPSLAAAGARAGLARSSVYAYFSSREDLLAAVVDEVLPQWAESVVAAMDRADSPAGEVWAYIEVNVEMFNSAEQAAAQALTKVVDPALLAGAMKTFHDQMRAPLVDALERMGEPDPDVVADLVGLMTVRSTRTERPDGTTPDAAESLGLLRRMLSGWLGLPELPEEAGQPGARTGSATLAGTTRGSVPHPT